MKRIEFILLKKDVPKITGNTVLVDGNVGGVKLVYLIKEYSVKEIRLFNRTFLLYNPFKYTKTIKTFLRPFKKYWNTSRNRLAKNYWGKPLYPLTNLWIELENDYKDIRSTIPVMKEQITNHSLIKQLRQCTENFYFYY